MIEKIKNLFKKKFVQVKWEQGVLYELKYSYFGTTFYHVEQEDGIFYMKEGGITVYAIGETLYDEDAWAYIKQFTPLPKIIRTYYK